MRIIDISQELLSCAVYPGDTAPSATRVKTINPDSYNLTDVSMSVHNGTHIDAPRHFIGGGKAVDELPLDVFCGKCTVKEWDGVIPPDCTRLLIKGGYEFTAADARKIVGAGVKLIGVETQSVGLAGAPREVHLILLGAEMIPLEGLRLSDVTPGEYALYAFPINISGSDGAPVRAVLIEE